MATFDTPKEEEKITCENILGKGENAGNQHFLLFPQCFLSYERNVNFLLQPFYNIINTSYAPEEERKKFVKIF